MATSTMSGLSLPCLVLTLLLEIPGAGAQEDNFQLLQPRDPVSVPAGGTLTLTCSVSGNVSAGPVKWFKGSGSGRQLVYAETGSFPRVTKVVPGSSTDFTILIPDTRPEDAGVYHCVKFRKGAGNDTEIRSGPGTSVSVSARPSAPSVSGPPGRAEPGSPVTFTCTSGGFSPRDIAVTWLRNGAELRATQTQVLPEHGNVTYSVSSTVGVTLTPGDVRSQLTCQIRHSSLSDPLNGTYSLSDALRGSGAQEDNFQLLQPQDTVSVSPGGTLTLTCSVSGNVPVGPVSWFKGSGSSRQLVYAQTGSFPRVTRAVPDSSTDFTIHIRDTRPEDAGVYHCVKFRKGTDNDTEIRSGPGTIVSVSGLRLWAQSPVTARAFLQDSQPPIIARETLRILQPTADAGQSEFASPGLWIGLFLEKVLIAAFLLFLFLREKA